MKEIIIEVPENFGKTLKPEKVNSDIKGEIVRCRDCKKRYKRLCGYFYADGRIMCDDWFCADGEHR